MSHNYIHVKKIQIIIISIIIICIMFLFYYLNLNMYITKIVIISGLCSLLYCLYSIIVLRLYYESYLFKITEHSIEVREGILFRKETFVPMHKIYQVKASKGPILRKYNLFDLEINTAAGTVYLTFITEDIVRQLEGLVATVKEE